MDFSGSRSYCPQGPLRGREGPEPLRTMALCLHGHPWLQTQGRTCPAVRNCGGSSGVSPALGPGLWALTAGSGMKATAAQAGQAGDGGAGGSPRVAGCARGEEREEPELQVERTEGRVLAGSHPELQFPRLETSKGTRDP